MLKENQRFLLTDSIMENCHDIITVKNLNFDYTVCNRAFLKLFGFFHETNVLGKNIKDIIPQEAYDVVLRQTNTVYETREPQNFMFNLPLSGEEKIITQLCTPVVENGEITGFLSISRDITIEENLKFKLMNKICELDEALKRTKGLEAQKELFLATLTHDLKNPVQAQLMSLKMLKNGTLGSLSQEQNNLMNILLESSEYMQEMLLSILNTYKYENGIIKLNKQILDINKLMENCLNEIGSLAKSKNIKIIYNNKFKEKIYADSNQIRRVISNLINNALNYCYQNSEIKISIYKRNKYAVFEFQNIGEPISDELKQHIFDKYVTGNKLTGAGLGLYFSKKVIDAHDGKIYLITDKNICKFIFELPIIDKNYNSQIDWT